ncbi:MAG TPA: hypothetical protein VIK62_00260 [Verrucomicrobiae bacterium]
MKKSAENEELLNKAAELQKLMSFYELTCYPLHSDFNYAVKQWQLDRTSQFWSRTSIRCLCATVEATLFSFRKIAEKIGEAAKIQFDLEEIEILSEKQTRNGFERPKFLSPSNALKESFRLFGKSTGTNLNIDYGNGFPELCETFNVRNRLMHPKMPFDIAVNTKDIETADIGIAWFNKTCADIFHQCQAQIGQNIKNIIAQQAK